MEAYCGYCLQHHGYASNTEVFQLSKVYQLRQPTMQKFNKALKFGGSNLASFPGSLVPQGREPWNKAKVAFWVLCRNFHTAPMLHLGNLIQEPSYACIRSVLNQPHTAVPLVTFNLSLCSVFSDIWECSKRVSVSWGRHWRLLWSCMEKTVLRRLECFYVLE